MASSHPSPPAAFLKPSFQCGIHSDTPTVSDWLRKITPSQTAPIPLRILACLIQLGETEFDDDFLILGQLHPLNKADQQFPALSCRLDKSLYQFPGPVLTADGAFFLKLQGLPLFLQLLPLQFDPAEDALEVLLRAAIR